MIHKNNETHEFIRLSKTQSPELDLLFAIYFQKYLRNRPIGVNPYKTHLTHNLLKIEMISIIFGFYTKYASTIGYMNTVLLIFLFAGNLSCYFFSSVAMNASP